MLKNQILVVGLEANDLEKLNQIKDDFIFIAIPSLDRIKPQHLKLQGLIFKPDFENKQVWIDLAHAFKDRCSVCISDEIISDWIKTFQLNFQVQPLEDYLCDKLGTLRPPPSNVGLLEAGTVVKNKIFPSWGIGVITQIRQDGICEVKYPNIPKNFKNNMMSSHKSQLRIICDIKEINYEEAN